MTNADSHCAVCLKLIFTFERKLSVSDMKTDEQIAFASLRTQLTNVNFANVPTLNDAIVCAACFRRVQGRCETKSAENVKETTNTTSGDTASHDVKQNAETSAMKKGSTRIKTPSNNLPQAETPGQSITANRGEEKPDMNRIEPGSSKSPETRESDQEEDGEDTLRSAVFTISAATLGALAAVVAAPAAVASIGFGAGGAVAGSAASSLMSTGLGVVLQSIGMTGFGVTGTAVVGTAGGAVGAGVGSLMAKLTASKANEDESPSEETGKQAESVHGDCELLKGIGNGESEVVNCKTSCSWGEDNADGRERHSDESDPGDKNQDTSSKDAGEQNSNVGVLPPAYADQGTGMSALQQEITVAAASAVSSGISLVGTSTHALMQDGYWVTCGIEVENWTRFPLISPHVQLKAGALTMAPSVIVPAAREVMVARKSSGTATGSCGTVSWLIQDANRRLVIMWSAPFNFNHHSNWLAVGLSAPGVTEHAANDVWFDQMYYDCDAEDLKFKLQEYYADVRPVFFRDAEFEVEGIMASDHKALVKVIFRPLNKDHLATNIKEKMLMK